MINLNQFGKLKQLPLMDLQTVQGSMNIEYISRRRFSNHIRWLAVAFSLFSVSLLLMGFIQDEQIHNSDILYAPSFYDDLWRGIDLTGWALTPAPYFFPDFFVYGFFDSIFHLMGASVATRVDLSLRFSSGALYTINGFLFALLLRQLFNVKLSIIGGLWIWFLFTLIIGLTPFRYDFLAAHIPTTHSGAITCTLSFWVFWFHVAKTNRSRILQNIFLFILIALSLLSDLQFLTLTVIPAVIVTMFSFLKRRGQQKLSKIVIRKKVVDLLLIGLSVVIAFRLLPRIRYNLIFFAKIDGIGILRRLFSDFPKLISSFRVEMVFELGLFTTLSSLFFFFIFFVWFSKRNKIIITDRIFSIFLGTLLTVFTAVVLQFGLALDYSNMDVIPSRYVLYLYAILLPILLAMIMYNLKSSFEFVSDFVETWFVNSVFTEILFVTVSAISLVVTLSFSSLLSRGKHSLANQQANCLTSMINQMKVKSNTVYGISDYWFAKRLSLFGSPKLRILPVYQTQANQLYFWITNLSWFSGDEILYQFVITKDLDETQLIQYYGKPITVAKCNGFDIWWYGSSSTIHHSVKDLRKFGLAFGLPWSQIK